jgi:glyoxylase-like metal-dependent hydrolase (beta-lactamase superfamily II)
MPEQLRPGLWRWSAPHPEWQPLHDDGTPTEWPPDVGCVLYETAGQAVLIDPLAPADDPAFWSWADERCRGNAVSVLETIRYHRRSRDEFISRYAASTTVPDAIEARPLPAFEETLYWIPEHRALVPGDCLLGAGDGELRLCAQSWLDELTPRVTVAQLRDALEAALRDLDVDLVLVSHWEPVRSGGGAALERALRAP